MKAILEWDTVTVDTGEWLDATAEDVTDYWRGLIERLARDDQEDGRSFYSSQSVSTWQMREARDRFVKAQRARAENRYDDGPLRGHTYNEDTLFSQEFGYDVVPYERYGMPAGYLILVSLGEHADYGVDYVYRVDSLEEAYDVLSPQAEYGCSHEFGDTRNGFSWETYTSDGSYVGERRDILSDGRARCSRGHYVHVSVRDSF